MRVLLIDPDRARAALVVEGLASMTPLEVREAASDDEREAAAFKPDLVVLACDSPDRDTLESLREASAANPRPVVMFVDRSAPGAGRILAQMQRWGQAPAGLSPAVLADIYRPDLFDRAARLPAT